MPRRSLVDPAEGGIFHCTSRCVRRAYLCGKDSETGKDCEHRKEWVRDRLQQLAGLFAIEVDSYAVMSNHMHTVLQTFPSRVQSWSEEEIACRWLQLFTGRSSPEMVSRPVAKPNKAAIKAFCQDQEKVEICRYRLADISWFMRYLKEPIARWANEEDDCTGRFWEGRFTCRRLEDAAALLSCMTYVDLNPVRARMAETPEESDFTSGQDRARAAQARRELARAGKPTTKAEAEWVAQLEKEAQRDAWLAPLGMSSALTDVGNESKTDVKTQGGRACETTRLSVNVGREEQWLSSPLQHVETEDYLQLLDWTGRRMKGRDAGRIPAHLKPILDRLDLDTEMWVKNVEDFGGLFFLVVGKLKRLREFAKKTGRAWFWGKKGAQQLYNVLSPPESTVVA